MTEANLSRRYSAKTELLLLVFLAFVPNSVDAQKIDFRFYGLKILVEDLDESQWFYNDILGLNVQEGPNSLYIRDQAFPIILEPAPSVVDYKATHQFAKVGLTLQVEKLLPSIDLLKAKNISFIDTLLSKNGVGISIPFLDPSGNILQLIEVQIGNQKRMKEFTKVYNAGVTISEMKSAILFYQSILGFHDWSRSYLPDALPLKHEDGSFAFMIHGKKGIKNKKKDLYSSPQMVLMLSTENLDYAKRYLLSNNVEVSATSNRLYCRDPEGNSIEVIAQE